MSTLYKRNLTILSVTFLIVMTFVGCGSNDKTQDENSSSSDSETVQQEESVTQEEASEEIPESESLTE